jgi:hypothetical protein
MPSSRVFIGAVVRSREVLAPSLLSSESLFLLVPTEAPKKKKMRLVLLLAFPLTLMLAGTVVSEIATSRPLFDETLYGFVGSPQVAVFEDSRTVLAVFEASVSSTSMGGGDQFVGLSCSADGGGTWLSQPLAVKLGVADRPMWRPVLLAQPLNASVGVVFLYFSQFTGAANFSATSPGGMLFQTSAWIGLSGSNGNCSLLTAWAPAEVIWDTFGYASANPLVTAAMPAGWWDLNGNEATGNASVVLPPSSWVLAISQLPMFGFSSYATLFISTENSGVNWTLASSTFSTQNVSEAYSNAQLTGSLEDISQASSSSSSSSTSASSSSSDADVGPLTSLASMLVNSDQRRIATTASRDAGSTWSSLLVFVPEETTAGSHACGGVDFNRPISSAAYYSSDNPVLAFFDNSSDVNMSSAMELLSVRQLRSESCDFTRVEVGPGVTSVGMSVQAVWRKPRPLLFLIVTANATVVRFAQISYNEAAPPPELNAATAIAITFCVVGGVYAVIVGAFVLGWLRARRNGTNYMPMAASGETPPLNPSATERQSLRRSVNERTILV